MRIEERLKESVARYGALPAIVAGRASHSYAELDLKSERLAAALQAGGVTRGQRVVLFMDDGWEAVVSIFAVLKAGGVVMPVGTGATAAALGERLQSSRPVAVVTQSRLAAMVAAAIAPVWSVRLIVLAGGDRSRAGGTCVSFEEAVGGIGHVASLAPAGGDGDAAVLIAGEAPLTHRVLVEDAAGALLADGDVMLPPLAERAGLSRLLAALAAGRTVVARGLFARDDDRRAGKRQAVESPFGISQLFETAMAGGAPVFQR